MNEKDLKWNGNNLEIGPEKVEICSSVNIGYRPLWKASAAVANADAIPAANSEPGFQRFFNGEYEMFKAALYWNFDFLQIYIFY